MLFRYNCDTEANFYKKIFLVVKALSLELEKAMKKYNAAD